VSTMPDRCWLEVLLESPRLLHLAALFEGDFSIDWLVQLTSLKASHLLLALEEGVRRGWLIKKGPGLFCFRDRKRLERLREELDPTEKKRLRRGIVELLLVELPDGQEKALNLAPHLMQSRNDLEGCRWLMRAGDAHLRAYRREEALQCYAKAIEDLLEIGGEEGDSLFVEAAIGYAKISTARQSTGKVLSILNQAMERAKRLRNRAFQALLEMHIAKNEWLRSRYRGALTHFEHGWSMARGIEDPSLLRSVHSFVPHFFYWQGRFAQAVREYEKSVPDVEKYPLGRFSLLTAQTVGVCYAHIGQVTQGLGMVDGIRTHCMERGDRFLAAHAGNAIGAIMLEIRRMEDAVGHLEWSLKEAKRAHNDWILFVGRLMLAFAHYLRGENDLSLAYLRDFLRQGSQVQVTAQPYPYLMEMCWAMEDGRYPRLEGLCLQRELMRAFRGKNVFMKGVAHRYLALQKRRDGQPPEKILASLRISLSRLEESGHQVETAKTRLELARQFLLLGEEEKAKETGQMAVDVLRSFNDVLVPDDLRSLFKRPASGENLLKEILKHGQEMARIRNNRDLVQHIISTVNRITGAERGAIFLIDGGEGPSPRLAVRATKNLTSAQLEDPGFSSSIEMIEEVARTGKGCILGMGSGGDSGDNRRERIRSRICVPMLLNDRVVGVLYHDNRLLSSAFKESDLELLSYFAAQAAIALDVVEAYEEISRLNRRLDEEKRYYEEQHIQSLYFDEMVVASAPMRRVLSLIEQVAGTDTTVLITGETGVGKELVARAIHRWSHRRDKPFIRVHCSALPESLIPSELFGHERGAFTGAVGRRIGRFELADGGTLFLDEIGDLPLEIQVRLLRVLQTKEFERVGGIETLRSDFRLVVATNRDLETEVKAGRFRSDLFYRLNVFPIHVPPLRDRKEDIPLLADHFLKIHSTKTGKSFEGIPREDMERLMRYDWPGNVRELENIMERGAILSRGPHFRVPELGTGTEPIPSGDHLTLKEYERLHIRRALQSTGWRIKGPGGAAALLDIHPSTLRSRMKKLGLQRPRS
jgi:formate hydrogenlyase transcriptional activator